MPGFDWDAPLTDAQRDALIEEFVQKIAQWGLHTPAILFLELHKPLAFLAGQSVVLGSGFLAPLFGPHRVQQYAKLLESRSNIDRVITRLEAMQVSLQK